MNPKCLNFNFYDYEKGIIKVNKEKEYGEKDSKNSVLLLTVGYKFKL